MFFSILNHEVSPKTILFHLYPFPGKRNSLPSANFTPFARFNPAVNGDFAVFNQMLGQSAAVTQPGHFKQIVQLNVVVPFEIKG